jgi:hypothetical protein
MWELRTTFSEPNPLRPNDGLEQSGLLVETLCEALSWWECRTRIGSHVRRTHVMLDPNGRVAKIKFD